MLRRSAKYGSLVALLNARPATGTAKASGPLRLAKAAKPEKALVLDYVAVASTATNLTFQGDSTYYFSGGVILLGTTVIDDVAVLKFTNLTSAGITLNGPLTCQGNPCARLSGC